MSFVGVTETFSLQSSQAEPQQVHSRYFKQQHHLINPMPPLGAVFTLIQ